MTALVGIYCSNGIVIGADSAATSSAGNIRTIEQPVMKIDIIDGRFIIAGTGQIGMGQRFCNVIDTLWVNKEFKDCNDEFAVVRRITGKATQDFGETGAPKGQYGALVAFPWKHNRFLVEFAATDLQPEFKNDRLWYVSMGSGQMILDPFLGFMREVFWRDGPPTVQDGVFATTWLLDHAVKVNPGGVNDPVRIAVLEKDKDWSARLLTDDELLEHRSNVDAAKEALRNYRIGIATAAEARELPSPPGVQPG